MSRAGQPVIVVDDWGVKRRLPDGKVEQVAWTDLVEVSIVTTDDGPFTEDLYFLLVGRNGSGCLVPSEAEESDQLYDHFKDLPGFDYGKAIEASKSVENARFICWQKNPTA